MTQALREVLAALPAWLQSSSVSAQLAAAGYSTQHVLTLLQSAAQALQDAPGAGAAAFVSPELMRELGLALFNLPISTACNNLRCSSLAGLSEQQLVVGTARLCAGCRVTRWLATAAGPVRLQLGSSISQPARLSVLHVQPTLLSRLLEWHVACMALNASGCRYTESLARVGPSGGCPSAVCMSGAAVKQCSGCHHVRQALQSKFDLLMAVVLWGLLITVRLLCGSVCLE